MSDCLVIIDVQKGFYPLRRKMSLQTSKHCCPGGILIISSLPSLLTRQIPPMSLEWAGRV